MSLQLRQNLQARLEQRLKLTPQMIQSIEILLLPQLALEERIMHEVEANPVLEIAEDGGEASEVEGDSSPNDPTGMLTRDERAWALRRQSAKRDDDDDAPDKMAALEAAPDRAPSLAEHLLEQLRFTDMPPEVRAILPEVCWALDARGYLSADLHELFPDDKLEAAEHALELVRSCDPAGVGARDLADCLALQLARQPGDNSFELRLIREHLDDVLKNRLPVIAQKTGVDLERVKEAVEVIAKLDPKPGLPYARADNAFVVPDVILERAEDGEWVVRVPNGRLPRLRISDAYTQLYESPQADPRDKAYLKEKLAAARALIDAIGQRERTLLKIVTEIIKHQSAFLEHGQEHLRPLLRQDIADKIGMHVATVSRAVKDKYIQTPIGILPLAAFFSGGIATQDGSEAESSAAVKLRIQKLIDSEDKRRPLSDQEIADILAKEGLDISRRTVTKYRIAEGIPSTRQRRAF
ncbi:MAG: RNA polymerase factor sigma-54 [Planctomycetota bacterium]|nr:RNA polymerase factor sigma-54 [Planctomycetota bacterium]